MTIEDLVAEAQLFLPRHQRTHDVTSSIRLSRELLWHYRLGELSRNASGLPNVSVVQLVGWGGAGGVAKGHTTLHATVVLTAQALGDDAPLALHALASQLLLSGEAQVVA